MTTPKAIFHDLPITNEPTCQVCVHAAMCSPLRMVGRIIADNSHMLNNLPSEGRCISEVYAVLAASCCRYQTKQEDTPS